MGKKINFAEAYKEQKAAGVDIVDPMKNLITTAEPVKQIKQSNFLDIKKAERRTKRVQIVMTPQLFEQVKKEADKLGLSFNELVNQLCMSFTERR